jgi:hypothetical protein
MKKQKITRKVKHITRRKNERRLLQAGVDKLPIYTAEEKRPKFALIQTGSWGDNINSTLMFEPISNHHKGCIIDVYTSTYYASAFYNNPFVDRIIQYPAIDKQAALHLTLVIPDHIKNSGYDHIFAPHPMFNHGCWCSSRHPGLGENLIYAWVHALERVGIECPMPPQSILRLTEAEIQKVSAFCGRIPEIESKRNVLMECHGESGQTFWDPNWTVAVGLHLVRRPDTNLFISRRHSSSDVDRIKQEAPNRVFFVGDLSLRECAELFNRCQIFMSVSSGLSNACNTNWCTNDITWIETVNSQVVTSAPIRSEGKIFWHENNLQKFIQMLEERGI